ncbi:hypothetical protein BGW38_009725 [Lunasporangiospora selenospora]|uniref:Uncharacterized protein n=1 Tax=Lunasporangiospora selenospora TaxID=979761 RepID=A0A9P6FXH4_9FUNG|nr:hypothetical protein BGW38_009725 [Lunasporangiospora selenospora]
MLIEDSLNLHAQVLEDDVLRLVNIRAIHRVIAYMAKSLCALSDGDLFAQRAFSNGRDVRDLSFALVLHSLYVAATAPEYSCCVDADKLGNDHDDIKAMGEWVQFLSAWISKTGGTIRTNDFDVIFKVYRTLVNLNALSITLEAVGLYALSMKLLDRMICDYGLLHQHAGRQTRSDSGPTIHELKRRRREMKLQTIQQQDHGRWRFDDIIGEWVELSPEPKKIRDIQVYSSEEEEEDHEDGLYKDPGDTQSSRRKVTRRTNISQALAKAKAQSKTFSLDDSSDDSDTPPPEVQRILDALLIGPLAANSSPRSTLALNSIGTRVRYSLTPVSRTYPLRPLTSGEGYEGEVHESDRNEDGSLAYSDYSSNSQNENEVDYTSLATTTTWGNMQRDFSLESSFDFDDQVDQVDQDSQDNHDNCAENYDPDDPDDEDYVQEPVRYHWDRSRARRGASRSDNESESDEDNDDLRLSENEDENSANIVQEERAIELYSSSNDEDGTIDLPPVIVLDDTDDDSDKDIRGENGTDINSDSYSDNNDGSESDVGSSDDRRIGSGPNRASTLYRATKHTIHEEDRDAYSNTENDEVFSRVNLENYPSPNVGRVAAVVIPSLKTMQDDMPSINGDDTIHEIPGIEKYSDEDYVDPGEKSMRRTTKRTLRRHPRRNLPYPAKKSNGHSIHSQPIDQSDDSSVENDPQHWKANQRRLRTRIRKTLPPSSNKATNTAGTNFTYESHLTGTIERTIDNEWDHELTSSEAGAKLLR